MLKRRPTLHFTAWYLGILPAQTETTQAEQACLEQHARDCHRIAEIGVWHGVNTLRMRRSMAADGVLYAIDPFFPNRWGISLQEWIARREAARTTNGRVEFLKMLSVDAEKTLRNRSDTQFDFIFVDGDHRYDAVAEDWQLWTEMLAPHGVIALHDSRSHPGRCIDETGPVRFAVEQRATNQEFECFEEVDSLTVWRRRL